MTLKKNPLSFCPGTEGTWLEWSQVCRRQPDHVWAAWIWSLFLQLCFLRVWVLFSFGVSAFSSLKSVAETEVIQPTRWQVDRSHSVRGLAQARLSSQIHRTTEADTPCGGGCVCASVYLEYFWLLLYFFIMYSTYFKDKDPCVFWNWTISSWHHLPKVGSTDSLGLALLWVWTPPIS